MEEDLYQCLKKSNRARRFGQVCKWSGSVLDYAAHFKENHSDSCFKLGKNTAFYWRIPQNNCSDKGIFQYKSRLYLYEIDYLKEDLLHFLLTALNGEVEHYQLHLLHYSLQDYCVMQETSNINDLFKFITDRSRKITIPQQILDQYSDSLRRLKFKICFK